MNKKILNIVLIGMAGIGLLVGSMNTMRIPESTTMLLFGAGLVGIAGIINYLMIKK